MASSDNSDRAVHMDDSRIVQVAVAPNEFVADMWRQVLADEGIVAALKPSGAGHSFVANALNQHLVLVREDQADRAREIIDDFESGDDEDSLVEPES